MKIMNLKERNEDAVSPVIGVMLMLVVTIVIAAVVAAFAGGIATDTEPTPAVILEATVYEMGGDTKDKVVLQSLSGDRLEFAKLSVKVYSEKGEDYGTGTLPTTGYFNPGMIQTVELSTTDKVKAGETVKVVVVSNNKHTVFDKELIVKS